MTISYKCPSCGANLSFNADEQAMTCGFCNARIAPEDVALSSYIHNEPQAHKDADIDDAGVEPVPLPKTRNVHISERASLYSNEEAKQYLCNNCGAKVVTDHKTASTFCMYCGSPAIISERLSGEKKQILSFLSKLAKNRPKNAF